MDINVCLHARALTHAYTHTHTQRTVSFSTIKLYLVKLFINSCHFSSEPLLECRMRLTTTKSIEHDFEKKKKKKKKKNKEFVKHPVPKLCLLVKFMKHTMAEMTHINREDQTVLLKSKFYINVRVPS